MAFLAPALVIYAALTAYPVLRTFYNSFFTIGDINTASFVGFDHFKEVFKDATFRAAVRNTAIWALIAPVMDVATLVVEPSALKSQPESGADPEPYQMMSSMPSSVFGRVTGR